MDRYWWFKGYMAAFVAFIGCFITAVIGAGGPPEPSSPNAVTTILKAILPLWGFAGGALLATPVYRTTIPGPRSALTMIGFFMVMAAWVFLSQGQPVLAGVLTGLVAGLGTTIALPRPSREYLEERKRRLG